LASTTVMDFLRPLVTEERKERGPRHGTTKESIASRSVLRDVTKDGSDEATWLGRARWATIAWGGILFAVALVARNWGGVLQAGLSIASILYGALLGVFLLGLLTKRVGEVAAMCGMTSSLILMLYIRFLTPIAFTWYVLIGTA